MLVGRLFFAVSMVAMVAGCASKQQPDIASTAGGEAAKPVPGSQDGTVVVTGSRVGREESRDRKVAAPMLMAPPAPVMTGYAVAVADAEVPASATSSRPVTDEFRYFVPPVVVATDPGREVYDGEEVSPVKIAAAEPVSTFSVDVDTGAYANARRFLTQGLIPPRAAVRTEELINYFRYDYAKPDTRETPFSVSTDLAVTPWNPDTRLMRIGLRGYDLPQDSRPPANLVFLLDVSGSMNSPDKLPLVKTALTGLANQLTSKDKVSIVVYAGAAGLVLDATSNPAEIRNAIDQLSAGGSTAGGAGIELAYRIAEANRIEGGVNRVILATDGDFNVGISDRDLLTQMIETKRASGITLTTLGFGTGNINDALMEQLANKGNGNYAYIDSALEARKVLGEEMGSTIFTIAKDVKIQVEFNPAVVSQYRLIGYENRALREEDFNNDKVDAGDIGAGHQVTAIYEIVPAGKTGWIEQRRYEAPLSAAAQEFSTEAAYVKLRYKLPDGDTSKLITTVVPASQIRSAQAPTGDFAFAVAVAAFGQKLRADNLLGDFGFDDIERLSGSQGDFYRQEFRKLVGVADGLGEPRSGG
jgi:Ca-activated chloride channel family protein